MIPKETQAKLDEFWITEKEATPGVWIFDSYSTIFSEDTMLFKAYPKIGGDTGTPEAQANCEYVQASRNLAPDIIRELTSHIQLLEKKLGVAVVALGKVEATEDVRGIHQTICKNALREIEEMRE